MQRYLAHGLVLSSNDPIPALQPADAGAIPEVTIHVVRGAPPDHALAPDAVWFESPFLTADARPAIQATRHAGPATFRLAFADGPAFGFDAAASAVWVYLPPGRTVEDAASYLLGPVLGILLRLRGVLCLHASAVAFGGEAVAFVGPQGSGKSTLAAACADAGHLVLGDDTVAVRPQGDRWIASPGYPRLRLWPDAAEAVLIGQARERAPAGGAVRRHVDLQAAGRYRLAPLPLRAIYLLEFSDPAEPLRIEAFTGADAVAELVANTFAGRALDRTQRGREFEALVALAGTVRIRRLRRPLALTALQDVVAALEHDAHVPVHAAT